MRSGRARRRTSGASAREIFEGRAPGAPRAIDGDWGGWVCFLDRTERNESDGNPPSRPRPAAEESGASERARQKESHRARVPSSPPLQRRTRTAAQVRCDRVNELLNHEAKRSFLSVLYGLAMSKFLRVFFSSSCKAGRCGVITRATGHFLCFSLFIHSSHRSLSRVRTSTSLPLRLRHLLDHFIGV